MKHTFVPYFIQCITNMHVGSGDANYGVVDKLVQRDPVTNYPTIHSSSLKGALREHFEKQWIHSLFDFSKIKQPFSKILEKVATENKKENKEQSFDFLTEYLINSSKIETVLKSIKDIENIFGKEAIGGNDSETGEYKFLVADLVSLPVRCNFQQYILALNKTQSDLLNQKAKLLTNNNIFNVIDAATKLFYKNEEPDYEVFAEDINITSKENITPAILAKSSLISFKEKFATFTDEDFKTITKNLPVIARNYIEDGTSENLWYEEIVPHQSVFLTFIAETDTSKSEFEKTLNDSIVQIGGNATIGYGLCKFYKLTF
jgi:CRISPR-associated protein Cmr4